VGGGFIFSVQAEGGHIIGLKDRFNDLGNPIDKVRLTDRFFLGEPQFRGFDIRGVGPRVVRVPYGDFDDDPTTPDTLQDLDEVLANNRLSNDSLGGRTYYLGRAELEIPLGSGARELGLRPSLFVDAGALFNVTAPDLLDFPDGVQSTDSNGNPLYQQVVDNGDGTTTTTSVTSPTAPDGSPNTPIILQGSNFAEVFLGDSPKPRVSVGVGVNWNSPFGPFRIDFAHVLMKEQGDDTKKFTFNVGTQF
jgi:outer membrane protein insertion porin family